MTITHVRPNDHHHLQRIADLLGAGSKILTVTGAGISTKAGIPDFRSKDGAYSRGRRRLFHSSVFFDPESRRLFNQNITEMRRLAKRAVPTRTHHFIRSLRDAGRLVRHYTQNIDCLEEKVGLSTNTQLGPGSQSRFRRMTRAKRAHQSQLGHKRRPQDHSTGVECVLLHGSLRRLRCSSCPSTFCSEKTEMATPSDPEPLCPDCTERSNDRVKGGKRATAIGRLRPDIVLYDEPDPQAESISAIARHDRSLRPDVLLIMGTSLATHGVQLLVRDFAKVIHKRGAGKVVFVNLTRPAACWDGVIDYWVEWDCDAWVQHLAGRDPVFRCENHEGRSIPKVLIDLTGDDEQLGNKGQGSTRNNPIDLTC